MTKKEKVPPQSGEKTSKIVFTGNLEEVNRFIYKSGWSYGMPVMPPTQEAVKEMLTGTDLPADHVVAKLPPMLGKATVEKIAINALMARLSADLHAGVDCRSRGHGGPFQNKTGRIYLQHGMLGTAVDYQWPGAESPPH